MPRGVLQLQTFQPSTLVSAVELFSMQDAIQYSNDSCGEYCIAHDNYCTCANVCPEIMLDSGCRGVNYGKRWFGPLGQHATGFKRGTCLSLRQQSRRSPAASSRGSTAAGTSP